MYKLHLYRRANKGGVVKQVIFDQNASISRKRHRRHVQS